MATVTEYTYPGVYLTEETLIPHLVTPATTNLTAVLGIFPQGPTDEAVLVGSWDDFEAQFGGLSASSSLAAYAVWQFFQNGGIGAWIVRLMPESAAAATATVGPINITAKGKGAWASDLSASFVEVTGAPASAPPHVNFVLTQTVAPALPVTLETVPNLPASNARELAAFLTSGSNYVNAVATSSGAVTPVGPEPLTGESDGTWAGSDFIDALLAELGESVTSPPPPPPPPPVPLLEQIAPAVFNLMIIPDLAWATAAQQKTVFTAAQTFCSKHQAFLILDPPPPTPAGSAPATLAGVGPPPNIDTIGTKYTDLEELIGSSGWGSQFFGLASDVAATYYPWVEIADPAAGFAPRFVPPSGTIAGVYAATDTSRGVWKAPAGIQAALGGVTGLADITVTDDINGELNVLGINCLRTFPLYGNIVWGARTLAGADLLGSPFKYVSVRRLTDFIEQSLQQSLKWAVFEPNGPALWASVALEAGTFMADLASAGAFSAPYQVLCDATTTSPEDMLRGVMNLKVGFAAVEPAEFVVINVQLNAGASAS